MTGILHIASHTATQRAAAESPQRLLVIWRGSLQVDVNIVQCYVTFRLRGSQASPPLHYFFIVYCLGNEYMNKS